MLKHGPKKISADNLLCKRLPEMVNFLIFYQMLHDVTIEMFQHSVI